MVNFQILTDKSEVLTLSERLWTSAARDLFVEVDPCDCFFASRHPNSTSFMWKITQKIKISNIQQEQQKWLVTVELFKLETKAINRICWLTMFNGQFIN